VRLRLAEPCSALQNAPCFTEESATTVKQGRTRRGGAGERIPSSPQTECRPSSPTNGRTVRGTAVYEASRREQPQRKCPRPDGRGCISLRHGTHKRKRNERDHILFLLFFVFGFASLALKRSPPSAPSPILFQKDSARKTNEDRGDGAGAGTPRPCEALVPSPRGGGGGLVRILLEVSSNFLVQ